MTSSRILLFSLCFSALLGILVIVVAGWKSALSLLGWNIQRRNRWKRERLRDPVEGEEVREEEDRLEQKSAAQHEEKGAPYTPPRPKNWKGFIGFFHPFWWDLSFVLNHNALN